MPRSILGQWSLRPRASASSAALGSGGSVRWKHFSQSFRKGSGVYCTRAISRAETSTVDEARSGRQNAQPGREVTAESELELAKAISDAVVATKNWLDREATDPPFRFPTRSMIGYRYNGVGNVSVFTAEERWPDLASFEEWWLPPRVAPEMKRLTVALGPVAGDPRRPWLSPPEGVVFPGPDKLDSKSAESLAWCEVGFGLIAWERGTDPLSFASEEARVVKGSLNSKILEHDYEAYLENFDCCGADSFRFEDGITLRPLTDEERSVAASVMSGSHTSGVPALNFDSMALRMSNIGWVLEARRPFPSQITLAGEPAPDFPGFPEPAFGSLLTLFRIYSPGFPSIPFVRASPVSWMYPGSRSMGPTPRPPIGLEKQLLNRESLGQIRSLWSDVAAEALESKQPWWRTSIHRFNSAYSRFTDEDRLVDLCVCLEACLGRRRESGKGKKVAERATSLLGSTGSGTRVAEIIQWAFGTRNRVLHPEAPATVEPRVVELFTATRSVLLEIVRNRLWANPAPPTG